MTDETTKRSPPTLEFRAPTLPISSDWAGAPAVSDGLAVVASDSHYERPRESVLEAFDLEAGESAWQVEYRHPWGPTYGMWTTSAPRWSGRGTILTLVHEHHCGLRLFEVAPDGSLRQDPVVEERFPFRETDITLRLEPVDEETFLTSWTYHNIARVGTERRDLDGGDVVWSESTPERMVASAGDCVVGVTEPRDAPSEFVARRVSDGGELWRRPADRGTGLGAVDGHFCFVRPNTEVDWWSG